MFYNSNNNKEILILLSKKHMNISIAQFSSNSNMESCKVFSLIFLVPSFTLSGLLFSYIFISYHLYISLLSCGQFPSISFLIFLLCSLPSLTNLIYLSCLVSVSNLFPCFPLTSTYPPANLLTFL